MPWHTRRATPPGTTGIVFRTSRVARVPARGLQRGARVVRKHLPHRCVGRKGMEFPVAPVKYSEGELGGAAVCRRDGVARDGIPDALLEFVYGTLDPRRLDGRHREGDPGCVKHVHYVHCEEFPVHLEGSDGDSLPPAPLDQFQDSLGVGLAPQKQFRAQKRPRILDYAVYSRQTVEIARPPLVL